MKASKRTRISLPDLDWKSSICQVCGKSFDYITGRKPPTCRDGICRYKYHFRIDKHLWAGHQFSFLERDRMGDESNS